MCKGMGKYMRTELRQPYKQFFGTLANQYRLDIVNVLRKGPLNVTDICARTGLKQATASLNLKRLELCGFVFCKREGKSRIYLLNNRTIQPLLNMMHAHMKNYCEKFCEVKQ